MKAKQTCFQLKKKHGGVLSKRIFPQLQSFEMQQLQKNAKNKNKKAGAVFW